MGWKEFWNRLYNPESPEVPKSKLPPVDRSRLVRKRIYFSGQVQGVGFRYRCILHAKELGVTGWAKNLLDGRVLAEFQADEAHISALIEALKHERFIRITDVDIRGAVVKPEEDDFNVDYF